MFNFAVQIEFESESRQWYFKEIGCSHILEGFEFWFDVFVVNLTEMGSYWTFLKREKNKPIWTII